MCTARLQGLGLKFQIFKARKEFKDPPDEQAKQAQQGQLELQAQPAPPEQLVKLALKDHPEQQSSNT